ncbi:uncharacterized protein LOC123553877 isoform X2 [Mercenaria mercenaria]|uniref:uncharacterized protein LOC123553877 isoform X2 n=1 Tax=Mercenaria mercenaria TaxID=6596 RepID=UPI00234F79C9|nr:uncharacterized protein LOC123553877 isoform X2 [Mercenaria mercenaria]
MKTASFFSLLKQNGHVLLSLSGIGCLVLSLFLIASSNSESDRRYNEILDHLAEMKKGGGSMNADIALKQQFKRGNQAEDRRKRDVDEHEKPKHVPHLYESGIVGGSWHDHQGAATNFQCLPHNPVWGRFTSSAGNAFMYGVEYNDGMVGIMDLVKVENNLQNQNVPCAVCRSSVRVSSLMVPGKNDCFDGWYLEYNGYLMAGHHGSKAGTQYICVDESPEADPAGYRDEDGALLYRVTAQCGSLPCPRYVQNREFTCAICTK